jgi:hypothetical protein
LRHPATYALAQYFTFDIPLAESVAVAEPGDDVDADADAVVSAGTVGGGVEGISD